MTDFSKKFATQLLSPTVLKENSWFTDLLLRWHPAGDIHNSDPGNSAEVLVRDLGIKCDMQNLRVAFRGGYMNFYCGGRSVAKVNFGRDGLQAKIHVKYVYGSQGIGQKSVTLTSKGFPELITGRLIPYGGLQEWISNVNPHIGTEKRFVDLIVAHNSEVIDLEMGLPAYIPEEPRAPRMDLVALEPHESGWRIVLWEVKLVSDPRIRRQGGKPPEVVRQLEAYTQWLGYGDHESLVAKAYQENCRLLVGLHKIASDLRPDIEELGIGIGEVAASDALPLVDIKPRLLVVYDKDDKSFVGNGHLAKLRRNGLCVQTVESLSELPLCGQS